MSRRRGDDTIGALGRAPARQAPSLPSSTPPVPGDAPDPHPVRTAVRNYLHGALFDNLGLKFLSLVLAVTVFLLVNNDKDREITVAIPVHYEIPTDKVLVSDQLEEVRVTIKGPFRRLRRFDQRELLPITLSPTASGDLTIVPEMIPNLPPGLSVTNMNPRTAHVQFDKRVDKLVEVMPVTTGRLQHGYIIAETKATPATVRVRGGERLLAALSAVRTNEISLEGRTSTFDEETQLAPPEGVVVDPGQRVTVRTRITMQLDTREVPSVPVTVRGDGIDPARWSVTPPQVDVALTGAVLAIESAKLAAYIKLAPGDTRAREAEVTIEGVPPGVGVRISPERVKVQAVLPTKQQ
jgi:YbbR domain-containing protein